MVRSEKRSRGRKNGASNLESEGGLFLWERFEGCRVKGLVSRIAAERRQAPRSARDDLERARKNSPSFFKGTLVKDNVKDILWITFI